MVLEFEVLQQAIMGAAEVIGYEWTKRLGPAFCIAAQNACSGRRIEKDDSYRVQHTCMSLKQVPWVGI
jgi:hypothetical protein